MMEDYFESPHVRVRLAGNVLSSVWDDYTAHLKARGHPKTVIQAYVQSVEHFGRWLGRSGRTPQDVSGATVRSFLRHHLPRCRCRFSRARYVPVVRAALAHLLVLVAPAGATVAALTPIDAAVAAFEAHLRDACGLAAATRCYYVRYVREFLKTRFSVGAVDLSAITRRDFCTFVSARAATVSPASAHTVTTAMRSFLRYLALHGFGDTRWAGAFPLAAVWSDATLPRVLSDAEVGSFVAVFDRSTAWGRCGYAMALCLVLLGLRTSEVARLALDDIEWRAQKLTIAAGKTRRAGQLPLPAPVAAALADYLRAGRPPTTSRLVFVHHRAPRGEPLGPAGVGRAIRGAFARSGVGPCVPGIHVLRHTAATRMLRAGASLKEIADVLGHRTLDTSARYAKVDIGALSGVALPWPEERP